MKQAICKVEYDLPPTTNHIYGLTVSKGKVRKYLTNNARNWKQGFGWKAKRDKPKIPLEEPLEVEIEIHLTYDRDVDNMKLVFDALEGIYYKNDKYIKKFSVEKFKDGKDFLSLKLFKYAG